MDEELRNALISKNTFIVKHYASKGVHGIGDNESLANHLHKNKWTLQDVVDIGRSDLTKIFIESDASIDVNSKENSLYGRTSLHVAVYNFDEDHVKLLLDYNADPNIFDKISRTPISYLYDDSGPHCNHDSALEILKMMINRGAEAVTVIDNVSILQVEGVLCLGNAPVINTTLGLMNIDMRAGYRYGKTVAHYLAQNVYSEFSKTMRDRDFDVNARSTAQETPLFLAASINYTEAVRFLLSKGADVNAVTDSNWTPLYAATRSYNEPKMSDKAVLECVMLLLEHGADIQLVSTDDYWPHTIFDLIMKTHTDDKLCKVMLQHLALQESAGTKITSLIQSKINSNEGIKKCFNYCKMRLATKVILSETLFKLLTVNEENLIPYMRNEELKVILFSCCHRMKSNLVYYHRLLQKRLIRAEKVGKLRDAAAVVIGKLMGIDGNCYPFVLDTIMRYLDCQDLNSLLSV